MTEMCILSRPKAGFQRNHTLMKMVMSVSKSVGQLVTLKITARESKTREIWQSDGAQNFFGGSYDVSHQSKTCDIKIRRWDGAQIRGQVAPSSINISKIENLELTV